ncbi:hypothetical protein THAOC_08452, partial [Thalassiosira oceanica]
DGQETELASHRGSYGDNNHEESICLDDGLYSFTFYDSYGDGFNGEFSLTLVPGETIIMRDNSQCLMLGGLGTGDYIGESVAIDGDAIVIGAYGDDDNGSNSGSAHVFVCSGEEWTRQVKLLAPDGAPFDYFGLSVAIYIR